MSSGLVHALVFLAVWFTLAALLGLWLGGVLRENERPFADDSPPAPLTAQDWWGDR